MKKKLQEEQERLVVPITKQDTDKQNIGYIPDITIQSLDKHIDIGTDDIFKVISSKSFVVRLWYAITNPLCYIFGGYIRY